MSLPPAFSRPQQPRRNGGNMLEQTMAPVIAQQEQAQEEAVDQENSQRLAVYEAEGRPTYRDPASGLVTPSDSEETWQARQAEKFQVEQNRLTKEQARAQQIDRNANNERLWRSEARPHFTDARGDLVPEHDDKTWATVKAAKMAEQTAKAQQEIEAKRRAPLKQELDSLQLELQHNPDRQALPTDQRRKLESTLKQQKQAARLALQQKLELQAKEVDTGSGLNPFDNKPTAAAKAAQERLNRLYDPNQDLADEDVSDLENTAPPVYQALSGVRDQLKADDERRTWREQNAKRLYDLKLKHDNPDAWEAQHLTKLGSLPEPEAEQTLKTLTDDFTKDNHELSQQLNELRGIDERFSGSLSDLRGANQRAKETGIPAKRLVTLDNGETWDAEVLAQAQAAETEHATWKNEAAPREAALLAKSEALRARAQRLQAAQDGLNARKAQAAQAQLTQLASTHPELAAGHAKLNGEAAVRMTYLEEQYPEGVPPEAIEALNTDLQQRAEALSQEQQARDAQGQQLYRTLKGINPTWDWSDGDAVGDMVVKKQAAALGLSLEQAKRVIAQQAAGDWSLGDTKAPTRITPTGQLLVNPALIADEKQYKAAVDKATAAPEAKQAALAALPDRQREYAQAALPVLTTMQDNPLAETTLQGALDKAKQGTNLPATLQAIGGLLSGTANTFPSFNQFSEQMAQAMPGYAARSPSDKAADYLKIVQGRSWFSKLQDQISTNLMTGTVALGQQVAGVAGFLGSQSATAVAGTLGQFGQMEGQRLEIQGANSDPVLTTVGALAGAVPSLLPGIGAGKAAALAGNAVAGTQVGQGLIRAAGLLTKAKTQTDGIQAATQMARAMFTQGTAVAGSAVGAGAQTLGSVFSDAVQAYQTQGMTPEDAMKAARAPAMLAAFGTAALTFLGGAKGAEALLKQEGAAAAKTAVATRFSTIFKGIVKEAGEEGLEEGFDQLWQGLIEKASFNPGKPINEILSEALQAAAVGGVLGGAVGGVQGATEPLAAPVQNRPETVALAQRAISNFALTDLAQVPAALQVVTPEGVPDMAATHVRAQDAAFALLDLAQGADITTLPSEELAAMGLERKGDKISPVKASGPEGAPAVPMVEIDGSGQAVITQPALDWLAQSLPEVRRAVGLDEQARREQLKVSSLSATSPDKTAATSGSSVSPGSSSAAPAGAVAPVPASAQAKPADANSAPNSRGLSVETAAPAAMGAGGTPQGTAGAPPAAAVSAPDNTTPEAQRATELERHLTTLGLPATTAKKTAAHLVKKLGVVGEHYTEQVVAPGFNAELKALGFSGSTSLRKAEENPLTAPKDLEARLLPAAERSTGKVQAVDGQSASPVKAGVPANTTPKVTPLDGQSNVPSSKGNVPGTNQLGTIFSRAARSVVMTREGAAKAQAGQTLNALGSAIAKHHAAFDDILVGPEAQKHLQGRHAAVQVINGKVTLMLDLDQYVAQHAGISDPKAAATSTAREELWHALSLRLEAEGNPLFTMAQKLKQWRALPAELKQQVWQSYHALAISTGKLSREMPATFTETEDYSMAEEYLRMLAQNETFQDAITETVDPDGSLLTWIRDVLAALGDKLKQWLKQATPDVRADLQMMVTALQQAEARFAKVSTGKAAQVSNPHLPTAEQVLAAMAEQQPNAFGDAALNGLFDTLPQAVKTDLLTVAKAKAQEGAKFTKATLARRYLAEIATDETQQTALLVAAMGGPRPATMGMGSLNAMLSRVLTWLGDPVAAQTALSKMDARKVLRLRHRMEAAQALMASGVQVSRLTDAQVENQFADLSKLVAPVVPDEDEQAWQQAIREVMPTINAQRLQVQLTERTTAMRWAALQQRAARMAMATEDLARSELGNALMKVELAMRERVGRRVALAKALARKRLVDASQKEMAAAVEAGRITPAQALYTARLLDIAGGIADRYARRRVQGIGTHLLATLNAVGIGSEGGNFYTADPNGDAYVERRRVILKQSVLDKLAEVLPASRALIGMDEAEARAFYGLPAGPAQPQTRADVDAQLDAERATLAGAEPAPEDTTPNAALVARRENNPEPWPTREEFFANNPPDAIAPPTVPRDIPRATKPAAATPAPATEDMALEDELGSAADRFLNQRTKSPKALNAIRKIPGPSGSGDNILSILLDSPIYMPNAKGRVGKAEWDWLKQKPLNFYWRTRLFTNRADAPHLDEQLQELAGLGLFPGMAPENVRGEDVGELIRTTIAQYEKARRGENLDPAADYLSDMEAQTVRFEKDTDSGPIGVDVAGLEPGQVLIVKDDNGEPHRLVVKSLNITPLEDAEFEEGNPLHFWQAGKPVELTSVALQDGTTYGLQRVAGSATIFVDGIESERAARGATPDNIVPTTLAEDSIPLAAAVRRATGKLDPTQREALKTYRDLTKRVQSGDRLQAAQAVALEDAERTLGQQFFFDIADGFGERALEPWMRPQRMVQPALFAANRRVEQGFYSKLADVLETKMPNRADAQTIKGILGEYIVTKTTKQPDGKDKTTVLGRFTLSRKAEAEALAATNSGQVTWQSSNGVKEEELKWSGLLTWLDGQVQPVAKQTVLDYLGNEGAVRFEEVRMGEPIVELPPGWTVDQDKYGNWLVRNDKGGPVTTPQRTKEQALEVMPRTVTPTQYAQWQLPGGENYREVVLTMPVQNAPSTWRSEALPGGGFKIVDADGNEAMGRNGQPLRPTTQEGARTAVDLLSQNKAAETYTSSHFKDVPDYVAHMRVNERTDTAGKPGLFLEEVQSDRHQAGRDKGYREEKPNPFYVYRATPEGYTPFYYPSKEAAEKDNPGATVGDIRISGEAIPDAPFRKDWALAMVKRGLRDAVASGKDFIGWTVGSVQADRFDLSKQVDNVSFTSWPSAGEGMGILSAYKGETQVIKKTVPESDLASYIGKDVAKKLIETPKDPMTGMRYIEGDDLKVGGQGMTGFYDNILPKEVQKYVKQWGAKVERQANGLGIHLDAENNNFPYKANATDSPDNMPYWRVDITPAMRASVAQGQALFAAERTFTGGLSAQLAQASNAMGSEKRELLPMDEAMERIESFHAEPDETDYWPEDVAQQWEADPLRSAVEDEGDFAQALPYLPDDLRNSPTMRGYATAYQRYNELDGRVRAEEKRLQALSKEAFWALAPAGSQQQYEGLAEAGKTFSDRQYFFLNNLTNRLAKDAALSEAERGELEAVEEPTNEANDWLESEEMQGLLQARKKALSAKVQARATRTIQQIEAAGRYKWDAKTGTFDEQDPPQVLFAAQRSLFDDADTLFMGGRDQLGFTDAQRPKTSAPRTPADMTDDELTAIMDDFRRQIAPLEAEQRELREKTKRAKQKFQSTPSEQRSNELARQIDDLYRTTGAQPAQMEINKRDAAKRKARSTAEAEAKNAALARLLDSDELPHYPLADAALAYFEWWLGVPAQKAPGKWQQALMTAVDGILPENGFMYNRQLDAEVMKVMGNQFRPEDMNLRTQEVDGGQFGVEVISAKRAVESQRSKAAQQAAAASLNTARIYQNILLGGVKMKSVRLNPTPRPDGRMSFEAEDRKGNKYSGWVLPTEAAEWQAQMPTPVAEPTDPNQGTMLFASPRAMEGRDLFNTGLQMGLFNDDTTLFMGGRDQLGFDSLAPQTNNRYTDTNAPATLDTLEPDRPRGDAGDAAGPDSLFPATGQAGSNVGGLGRGRGPGQNAGLGRGAAAGGATADDGSAGADAVQGAAPGPDGGPARGEQPGRGNRIDDARAAVESGAELDLFGTPPARPSTDAVATERAVSLPEKLTAQAKTSVEPTVWDNFQVADRDSIERSLPMLLPQQIDDVLKVERRFFVESPTDTDPKRGMLFTNGTGTGKTFTGLGIIRRFQMMGKSRILIVVPNQQKVADWKTEGARMRVAVQPLTDTNDVGEDLVVTTYANMRDNWRLQAEPWDLVVYDESHYLGSNQQGTDTANLMAHETLTRTGYRGNQKWILAELGPRPSREDGAAVDAYERAIEERSKQIQYRADTAPETRAVFLSATPFAYHKNLSYADGFLFTRPAYSGGSGYNVPQGFDKYLIENFGYSMRTNRLTSPPPEVDVGLMEREWAERMFVGGAMSGRMIDVPFDYSREFILLNSRTGQMLDDGFASLLGWGEASRARSDAERRRWEPLAKAFYEHWYGSSAGYTKRMQFLESIKVADGLDRMKEHIAMGRKVVLFHGYNNADPVHPFQLNYLSLDAESAPLAQEWMAAHPAWVQMDFKRLQNPRRLIENEFGTRARFFNGEVPKSQRSQSIKEFNDDTSGVDILMVQSDAGKEGISLHDTTGKGKQRVLMNASLPVKPTDAIQTEGRIYRIGVQSNAIQEYLVLHTSMERTAFGSKISQRTGTVENMALGKMARTLTDSFKSGYLNAHDEAPSAEQGLGGKKQDAAELLGSDWDRARSYYFGRMKKTSKTKAAEGSDYFATPEPVGLAMVKMLQAKAGMDLLEPSAGHGAIGRFFPDYTANKFVEPSRVLSDKLRIKVAAGKVEVMPFEDLHIVNKFDGVAMNPPFGTAGKLAMEHVAKAAEHLRQGGRLVAIIPEGPAMNKRFEQWLYEGEGRAMHLRASYGLPTVTFERAGTSVKTRIVVLDKADLWTTKQDDESKLWAAFDSLGQKRTPYFSTPQMALDRAEFLSDFVGWAGSTDIQNRSPRELSADTIAELFEQLENLSPPERITKNVETRQVSSFPRPEDRPASASAPVLPFDQKVISGVTFYAVHPVKDSRRWTAVTQDGRATNITADTKEDLWNQVQTVARLRGEAFESEVLSAPISPPEDFKLALQPAAPVAESAALYEKAETLHAKRGTMTYVAKFSRRIGDDAYALEKKRATSAGGYYSAFKGNGAIPGFQFPTAEARDSFVAGYSPMLGAAYRRVEGPTRLISASQFTTIPVDEARAREDAAKGGKDWAERVDLSEPVGAWIDRQDGKLKIFDGHHRWLAATMTGRPLKVRENVFEEVAGLGLAEKYLAAAPRIGQISAMASPEEAAQTNSASPGGLTEADAQYLDAVNRGDMETVQQMVDAAAKAAGFSETKFYHGNAYGPITAFDNTKSPLFYEDIETDDSRGNYDRYAYWFTPVKSIGLGYAGSGFAPGAGPFDDSKFISVEDRDLPSGAVVEVWPGNGKSPTILTEDQVKSNQIPSEFLTPTGRLKKTAQLKVRLPSGQQAGGAAFINLNNGKEPDSPRKALELARYIYNLGIAQRTTSSVMNAYLRMTNPKIVDMNGQRFGGMGKRSSKARFEGHDSIIINNVIDPGANAFRAEPTTSVAVFRPNQIKSSDPVTRDDQGNIIPLSRRFDDGNDIRGDLTLNKKSAALADSGLESSSKLGSAKDKPRSTVRIQGIDPSPPAVNDNLSSSAPALGAAPRTLDTAAHEAATSPLNTRPEPTDAQKKAGNYALGHVKIGPLDLSIENPAGSVRRGTDGKGKAWETPMHLHYGYVKGSKSADGDHIDTFVVPGTPTDYDGPVWVVNQKDKGGAFDEHKAVFGPGITGPREALAAYLANYTDGWDGAQSLGRFKSVADFQAWATEATQRRAPARGHLAAPLPVNPALTATARKYVPEMKAALGAASRTVTPFVNEIGFVNIAESGNGRPLFQRQITPEQDAAYLAAVEAGDMATAQRMVDAVRLKPREVFYSGRAEVIRNPNDSDYKQIKKEHQKEYPNDRMGETTRFTTDKNGNRYIWRADYGMHSAIEPGIESRDGVKVGQNEFNWNMESADPVVRDRQGNVIPLSQRFNSDFASILYAAPRNSEANPLARLGFNNIDRALTDKIAALTAKPRASAAEAVAAWAGTEKVKPFADMARWAQGQLFPDSLLPREITAAMREMNIRAALGGQKAMDLQRALSGTPKFSDLAYPPEFIENPIWRERLFDAMEGRADMAALPPAMQALGKRLRAMLVQHGREAVKAGRMSLETFEGLQENFMPRFTRDEAEAASGDFIKKFKLGVKDILQQRSTAWHIVDTTQKDPRTGEYVTVSHDARGKKWRFRDEAQRNAFYQDYTKREAVRMLKDQGRQVTDLLAALDTQQKKEVRAEIARMTTDQVDRPAELSPALAGIVKRALAIQRQRYERRDPFDPPALIRDPVYAIARYMAQAAHDNATAEFFNFVDKNPAWVREQPAAGYVMIPDNPRFGRLAGKHVQTDIAAQITEMVEAPDTALKIYDTLMGWWKTGKTVLNPGTHVRNVLGNLFFSQLAGNSPWNPGNVGYYKEAIAALRAGGPALIEAYEQGVLGADFVTAELRQTLRQLLPEPASVMSDKPELLLGIGKAAGKLIPQWMRSPTRSAYNQIAAAYQVEDEVFKLAAYLKAKGMGMDNKAAAEHVRKWFPYFDKGTSTTLKLAGRTAMPFLGFYRESARIFSHALRERPLSLATGLTIPSLITYISALMLGLNDEDKEEVMTDMRGKGGKLLGPTPLGKVPLFAMLLPIRTEDGDLQQIDLSAIHPFTDFLGTRVESRGGDWWEDTIRSMVTAGPLASLAYAQMTGRDAFGDRTFVEADMTGGEKAAARLDNAGATLLPPLTPIVGTGYKTIANAGQRSTNKTLEVRNLPQAITRAIGGVDLRNANPDLYRLAEDFRKENGMDTDPSRDYGTTAISRARAQVFAEIAQDAPDKEKLRRALAFLRTQGVPIDTQQDINRLLFYKDPLKVIGGDKAKGISATDAQQMFQGSLSPEGRRVLVEAVREFSRIQQRAPAAIAGARSGGN